MPNFDIDSLKSNPNAQITILLQEKDQTRVTEYVKGFIIDDVSINGANQFDNPFESSATSSLSSKLNKLIAAGNTVLGTEFAQMQLKHPAQTISSWIGSSPLELSIPLIFVAIRPNDDVRQDVLKLYKTVYPSISNGVLIKAPLDYTINGLTATKGTVVLTIGKWLRILGLLVTSVSFTFSKEVIESGVPLYAQGSVSFMSYKMITSQDLERYFI